MVSIRLRMPRWASRWFIGTLAWPSGRATQRAVEQVARADPQPPLGHDVEARTGWCARRTRAPAGRPRPGRTPGRPARRATRRCRRRGRRPGRRRRAVGQLAHVAGADVARCGPPAARRTAGPSARTRSASRLTCGSRNISGETASGSRPPRSPPRRRPARRPGPSAKQPRRPPRRPPGRAPPSAVAAPSAPADRAGQHADHDRPGAGHLPEQPSRPGRPAPRSSRCATTAPGSRRAAGGPGPPPVDVPSATAPSTPATTIATVPHRVVRQTPARAPTTAENPTEPDFFAGSARGGVTVGIYSRSALAVGEHVVVGPRLAQGVGDEHVPQAHRLVRAVGVGLAEPTGAPGPAATWA